LVASVLPSLSDLMSSFRFALCALVLLPCSFSASPPALEEHEVNVDSSFTHYASYLGEEEIYPSPCSALLTASDFSLEAAPECVSMAPPPSGPSLRSHVNDVGVAYCVLGQTVAAAGCFYSAVFHVHPRAVGPGQSWDSAVPAVFPDSQVRQRAKRKSCRDKTVFVALGKRLANLPPTRRSPHRR